MQDTPTETPLDTLRSQLQDAAAEFADEDDLADLMRTMADDVERASTEPLEVLPVSHHSPASGIQTAKRLHQSQPDVIYLEACEDLQSVVDDLTQCTLPVALQAFASESEAFPAEWTPLTVVAPLTEFSAEAQAIGYAMQTDAELVFVDRSVDHVFQSMMEDEESLDERLATQSEDDEDDGDGDGSGHGSALGLQIGDTEPTFEEFRQFLLRNARVRHWMEWWNQYVEQAVVSADYETYRHALLLIGSLLRRIGRKEADRAEDRFRERYMWTRINDHLARNDIDPENAVYICGAVHAASPVDAFGVERDTDTETGTGDDTDSDFEIPERTDTDWQYGLVPSSYREIDRQFGHPPGTIKRNEHTWKKTRRAIDSPSYGFTDSDTELPDTAADESVDATERLARASTGTEQFVARPPDLADEDDEQLLNWCIDIVEKAQNEGYAASTADSIAIFEHSKLLAKMRNRPHPTPYDFHEAAVTCIEKTGSPARDDVATLCGRLLGGNREGKVGYASMPPLAQDVYDRLEKLPIDPHADTVQRALLDLRENPEYREPADLLWRLHYLFENADVVRPIMASRELGHDPAQESWDILIGKNQRPLIELGYEGVTVEQVVEMRLKEEAFGDDADAASALSAARESILLLDGDRITRELGERAIELLTEETGADNASPIFEGARELVHYYRSVPDGVPDWLQQFVAKGYSHYASLLPKVLGDDDTAPEDIADMLGFIFTLESLALSMGRDRSELEIAVKQAGTVDINPDKVGLLWTAEWLLDERSIDEIRAFFDRAFENPMRAATIPEYLNGFVLAVRFTGQVAPLVVELISEAFARLPDDILLPWIPDLLLMLRPLQDELVPELVQEAGRVFPGSLDELDTWTPEWEIERSSAGESADTPTQAQAQTPTVVLDDRERAVGQLLSANRDTAATLVSRIDADGDWNDQVLEQTHAHAQAQAVPVADERDRAVRDLLFQHRETASMLGDRLALDGRWERTPAPSGGPAARLSDHERMIGELLRDHSETMLAVSGLLGLDQTVTDLGVPDSASSSASVTDEPTPVRALLAEQQATLQAILEESS